MLPVVIALGAGFIFGFMVGALVGVFFMALVVAGHEGNPEVEGEAAYREEPEYEGEPAYWEEPEYEDELV
jgi:hypothetical protein